MAAYFFGLIFLSLPKVTRYFAGINHGCEWRKSAIKIIRVLLYTQSLILIFNFVPLEYYKSFGLNNPAASSLFLSITVFFPLIAIFIRYGNNIERKYAFYTLYMSLFNIIFTSSRGALIHFIVGMFILFIWLSRKQKTLMIMHFLYIFAFLIFISLWGSVDSEYVKQTFVDSYNAFQFLFVSDTENIRDIDRLLHLYATIEVLMRSDIALIFGYGFRSAGHILAEPLFELYSNYLPHLDFIAELGNENNVATFGINILLVDYGILGSILFILAGLAILFGIIKQSSGYYRVLLISSLFFYFSRMYGNDFSGMILFYILILPFGVFSFMAFGDNLVPKQP